MFGHELLISNNLPEGCPELNRHDAEENEVDRAVQQSHHVHHLTKLEREIQALLKLFRKKGSWGRSGYSEFFQHFSMTRL